MQPHRLDHGGAEMPGQIGGTDRLVPGIDAALGGGLRRGQVSEIVGLRSTGRTSVMCRALGAAVARGELVALIDPCDRFDPVSDSAVGIDL